MNATVIVVAPDLFAASAATWIADLIRATVDERSKCRLCLCGGRTPVPVYEDLVGRTIRWSEVSVFFGDERAVPPDDPDSNFAMARRALLDRTPVPSDRIHRMEADRADLDSAARDYGRLLVQPLDILLLGVGPDGHTASLFPDSSALDESERLVVAVPRPPLPLEPQVERLTITPPVIATARTVVVLVSGRDKAPLMARILEGPEEPRMFPAQLARQGTWILDEGAAQHLHRRSF